MQLLQQLQKIGMSPYQYWNKILGTNYAKGSAIGAPTSLPVIPPPISASDLVPASNSSGFDLLSPQNLSTLTDGNLSIKKYKKQLQVQ